MIAIAAVFLLFCSSKPFGKGWKRIMLVLARSAGRERDGDRQRSINVARILVEKIMIG